MERDAGRKVVLEGSLQNPARGHGGLKSFKAQNMIRGKDVGA